MGSARLTAYGVTAKGSGYADADDACEEASSGTQLLAADNSAVYVYAEADDADEKIYLAKIAAVEEPSHLYQDGDGYAAGQKVYVPEQAIGGIFGTLTTAGYYTVALDGDISDAVYITTFADDEEITQPTECPDDFPNKESATTGVQYSDEFVDNQMSRLVTQYNRADGLESFVPTRMTVRGPSNLRGRPQSLVYKVTKE
jgi:hypothetical protein